MKWSLPELAVWAFHGHLADRVWDMLCPGGLEPPRTEGEWAQAWCSVETALGRGRTFILQTGVTAGALAGKERMPPWLFPFLEKRVSLSRLGLPFTWVQILKGRWQAFPLALVTERGAHLAWALMGRIEGRPLAPGWPSWWDGAADDQAREAVSTAMSGLEDRLGPGFFFWPLLPPSQSPVVFGPSLALPVYLAGCSLDRGILPGRILSTGALGRDLSLAPVGHLRQKARLAREKGFSAVLWPVSEESRSVEVEGVEVLEAESLDHACFLCELYSPGTGKDLDHQFHCLSDPKRLASNVHLLDSRVILWKGFERRYRATLGEILRETALIDSFVYNLRRFMDDPDASGQCLENLMAPFDVRTVEEIAASRPVAALGLTEIQLTIANHDGRIEEGETWVRLGRLLDPAASRSEEGLRLKVDLMNRAFLRERHNHYDFRMELPDELMETMSYLEQFLGFRRRFSPEYISPNLGGLYGTLAQNCGFCGPARLDALRRYVHLAQDAFGNGAVPEHEEDWRRQFCYLCYALMDAGRLGEARAVLASYLGKEPSDLNAQDVEGFNRFRHGAVARFLVDSGERLPVYERWMHKHLRDTPCRHPWQLWLLNAGLYLEDPGDRAEAFCRSLDRCLRLGPTVRAMGLMPLALLRQEGHRPVEWLREKTLAILGMIRNAYGEQSHFRRLFLCSAWDEVLSTVLRHRRELFPFTYR